MKCKWYEKNAYKRRNKKYSTSIENHCVVKQQLSISFELFITPIFPFIHFLQRKRNKMTKELLVKTFACIILTRLEHRTLQNLPGHHSYSCVPLWMDCVHKGHRNAMCRSNVTAWGNGAHLALGTTAVLCININNKAAHLSLRMIKAAAKHFK